MWLPRPSSVKHLREAVLGPAHAYQRQEPALCNQAASREK